MLNTLLKIGEQLSQKTGKWDDYLEKRGNKLIPKSDKKLYILNIIFDIENKQIIISSENLSDFDKEFSVKNHWLFQTFAARAGKTYVATLLNKIEDLKISFFGKDNESKGQLQNDIDNKFPELKNNDFYKAIHSIYTLSNFSDELNKKNILEKINLIIGKEAIIFCYASIKNSSIGINKPTELSQLAGFTNYFEKKFFAKQKNVSTTQEAKLCYASGEIEDDTEVAKYLKKGTINSMFVMTTLNYATLFDKKNFFKNYQLSKNNNLFIERAAFFLRDNYTVPIAGKYHIIIPGFFSKTEINYELALEKIKPQSDFLFKYKELKNLETIITYETDDDIYWLHFLSIDSDGKSFKTNNLIKDVSKPYFIKILETIETINKQFYNYFNSKQVFNFYTMYKYIPVKRDLKKNEALTLFKDILEHKTINTDLLFKYFTKYLICQRSGQFGGGKHRVYDNISENKNFDFAIKNAVFNYLAFIQVLKKLNLINYNNMEEKKENQKITKSDSNNFGKRIKSFFIKMDYNDTQKALFYLGRVLSQVAYAQAESKHASKPVLNKINYNGMDNNAIIRLHLDLSEKVRQYVKKINLNSVEYNFSNFIHLFNPNDKSRYLSSEENVFFLLSGYSFGMVKEVGSE